MRRSRLQNEVVQEQQPIGYHTFRAEGGAFGVAVTMPDILPAKVTSFPSRAAAQQWIDRHREMIEQQRRPEARPSYRQVQETIAAVGADWVAKLMECTARELASDRFSAQQAFRSTSPASIEYLGR